MNYDGFQTAHTWPKNVIKDLVKFEKFEKVQFLFVLSISLYFFGGGGH